MHLLALKESDEITNFFTGKEEEARVHQHMHAVAQRQVKNQSIQLFYATLNLLSRMRYLNYVVGTV